MTHQHVQDHDGQVKACLEISDSICLTRTTTGCLLHFDPPAAGTTFRQVGGFDYDPGGWTLVSGSFETGDLTIKPSIRISTTRDGREVELLHGWVRSGRWAPAGAPRQPATVGPAGRVSSSPDADTPSAGVRAGKRADGARR